MPERKDKELTGNQKAIIETLDRSLFVTAGAGSGKTEVVMRRFVEALSSKVAKIDQILTITFTEKAAGEMVDRARLLLRERNMIAERRRIEQARISTIHGFCSSLLRSHALALGLDPNFSVADESQSKLLREEAFNTSLERLIVEKGEPAIEMMFNFDPNRIGTLFRTTDSLYETLRCRGQSEPECLIPAIDVEGTRKNLRDAIADAYTALAEIKSKSENNRAKLEGLELALKQTDRRQAIKLILANKPEKRGKAKEVLEIVVAARSAFLGALHLDVVELLHGLLKTYAGEYRQNKKRAGVLDFEDLQLEAFRLLRDHDEIRKTVAESFRLIVVDEFQDTNQLQCEIIDRIARDNVCFVGDENQSIYRFRNADVDLFRKKRSEAAAAGSARTLPHNFRSQKEILNFVDQVFNRDGMIASENYLKLEAAADPDEIEEEFRVEVIVVDGDSHKKAKVDVTRPAEAELIARRLNELYGSGSGHEPGKTAILLRKKTDAGIYHDALTLAGIPGYLSIGRDFYQKLELGDAMSLLRLLVNPLDDLALLGVLRSPMVNVTDDTLVRLRKIAGRGKRRSDPPPLWPTVQSSRKLAKLPDDQREKLSRFCTEFTSLRLRSRRQSLETTVRSVIDFHDYAAMAAAGRNGRQAFANLMKLQDIAVDFEAVWGRDLAALVEYVENQRHTEAEEGDAPTEEEGGGAVRIMTIHSAKGLEFPLVVWANMGAGFSSRTQSFMCGEDGRIGLDYKGLPKSDGHLYSFDELNDEEKDKGLEEEKRIGYVAMTRAKRHLILCGTTNIDKKAAGSSSRIPFEWVKDLLAIQSDNERLAPFMEAAGREARTAVDDLEGCTVLLTVCTDPEGLLEESKGQAEDIPGTTFEKINAAVSKRPPDARFVPAVISPTALDKYRACQRRYFLDHVVYAKDLNTRTGKTSMAAKDGVLLSTNMGSLVHKIMEKDLEKLESKPLTSGIIDQRLREVLEAGTKMNSADYEYAVRLVENFKRLPVAVDLFGAIHSGRLQRELSFSTLVGQTILKGQIDALCPMPAGNGAATNESAPGEAAGTSEAADAGTSNAADAGTLVVDYKTGMPGKDQTPGEAAQTYRLQMGCYALAASRLRPGPVSVVLAYLGGDEPIEVRHEFSAADITALKNEIESVIDSMADGEFPPLDSFDGHQCPSCAGGPNGARLCIRAGKTASA